MNRNQILINASHKFTKLLVVTAKACTTRGKPMDKRSANGVEYRGWILETEPHYEERGHVGSADPRAWWEIYRDLDETMLLPDGTLIYIGFEEQNGTDGHARQEWARTFTTLKKFVGDSGAPFSEWSEKLKRFPYA